MKESVAGPGSVIRGVAERNQQELEKWYGEDVPLVTLLGKSDLGIVLILAMYSFKLLLLYHLQHALLAF